VKKPAGAALKLDGAETTMMKTTVAEVVEVETEADATIDYAEVIL
jgi:hypothetical protein